MMRARLLGVRISFKAALNVLWLGIVPAGRLDRICVAVYFAL